MSCNSTIPPFPSQDLAKLVLGYLSEEQLMTAYDEFLQASPYLDALQNEYDRIFMTSLKNILAEYRAVKIYVETCKPFLLRRKLFQCSNLLEMVKFLISNVDINKLHKEQESHADKAGLCRQSSSTVIKSNVCDVCVSLTLPNCVCRTRSLNCTNSQSTSQIEASSLESSVETTSLDDLPGNISYKKKIDKLPELETNVPQFISSSDEITNEPAKSNTDILHSAIIEGSTSTDNLISSRMEQNSPVVSPFDTIIVNDKSNEVVLESKNISNLVNNNKNMNICKDTCDINNVTYKDKRICNAGSFQDFATGVGGDTNKVKPDSSTSENFTSQTPTTEINAHGSAKRDNVHDASKSQLTLKVGTIQNNKILPKIFPNPAKTESHANVAISVSKTKPERQNSPKITILSDIKVNKDINIPPILKNAASTPLIQMQTLFINGTSAYKQKSNLAHSYNYTKDEIMAMPTIILVPTAGQPKNTVPTVTQNNGTESIDNTSSTSTGPTFGPLVIDVSASNPSPDPGEDVNENTKISHQNVRSLPTESGLLKTADGNSHASLPKNNALGSLNKTSTPQVPPPVRKSSSTPRRTSHVRVLDFTTPRRILHETLNEQVVSQCSSDDVVSNGGTNLPLLNADNRDEVVPKVRPNTTSNNQEFSSDIKKGSTKENKAAVAKPYNWDAELRALAIANGANDNSGSTLKPKSKKIRGRVSPKNTNNNERVEKSKISIKRISENKKKVHKVKSLKDKKKTLNVTEDIVHENTESASVPIKPTINIISANKWSTLSENDKSQNKTNNSDERIDTDTPELESMSLQNEIGAKLNISDLLETPYKQALYDIQMETPRFACPDIPGEPLSDIKIMNIPTPKYFNTPKVSQNTPSSYSSRPTDYSSGGSYYKPDDQDYVLATEVLECALSVSNTTSQISKDCKAAKDDNISKEKVCEGKSRPVRQCTKNVSYNYSSPSVSNKIKEVEDNMDNSSTCSDTSIIKSSEKKVGKYKSSKSVKESRQKEKKSETKKNFKKYKSPVKKELPKTFMKIKPRRTTPIKESLIGTGKKKFSEWNQNNNIKSQIRKKSIKEKKCITPIITAAPTKSRRKSSTPRKIHCTKMYNSENLNCDSPETLNQCDKQNVHPIINLNVCCNHDSDTEQLPLRWSDDGSQDSKPKERDLDPLPEIEDISKIKEYINTTLPNEIATSNEGEGTLHVDLIKRGFDIETARKIERDLLETPTQHLTNQVAQDLVQPNIHISGKISTKGLEDIKFEKSNESDCGNLQIFQDEDERDEFDLSVYECNEETRNYFVCDYNEATFIPTIQNKLKEKFSMEICIDDDLAIRLRATPLNIVFEQESKVENISDYLQTTTTNTPVIDIDNLYTPRKAQVYEIFDSTLTSLDTPLKVDTSNAQEYETTVTEIVLEVEKLDTDIKCKPDPKKRKRLHSGNTDDILNSSKKAKPDAPYILNSTNIQNIDIESVLSKLHGP